MANEVEFLCGIPTVSWKNYRHHAPICRTSILDTIEQINASSPVADERKMLAWCYTVSEDILVPRGLTTKYLD